MEIILYFDLPTWWFLIIGAIFTGYGILDGFDLGAGSLHLFFKSDRDRRIALNAIGPVWDGNEVWLVIGGGALFAAFPVLYASILSGFYIPTIIFVSAIIFRAVSIEFRSKEPMKWWRQLWDITYSLSSILIALLLGLILGNIATGIPIEQDFIINAAALSLFRPFPLLVAITTLSLFAMHGSIFLIMKTEHVMHARLTIFVKYTVTIFIFFYISTTIAAIVYYPHLTDKLINTPVFLFVPVLAGLNVFNILFFVFKKKYLYAFLASGVTIGLLLILVAFELYPNVLLSTISPKNNITIYNAASSSKSLNIMLLLAAIGTPLAITYTCFTLWTFRGKTRLDEGSY